MASGYVKIYGSILTSSLWSEDVETRVVWITMLAMADQHGRVEASESGLARTANVPVKMLRKALVRLSEPDIESKSKEYGGRRVEAVEGGWHILNYLKYREMQSPKQIAAAERQQRWRDKQRLSVTDVTDNDSNGNKRPTVAVAVTVTEKNKVFTTAAPKLNSSGTGDAAMILLQIRELAESTAPGGVRFIRTDRVVEAFGATVARAYKAIGGSERVLKAEGRDHSFLARDLAAALDAAREAEP